MPRYNDLSTGSVNYEADIKRRVINVDAAFKEHGAGSSITNFHFKLTTPVRNVAQFRVTSVEVSGITFADNYLLLQVNDESSIESRSTAGNEIRAVAKIPNLPTGGTGITLLNENTGLVSNVVAFRNPQDVAVLNVRVVNPDGSVATPGSGKVAFTLELDEVVNTYLYESRRKHIGFNPANV